MENEQVVTPPTTELEQPKETSGEVSPTVAPAGSKTDPNLLLKSLQEEREKRRLLEEELQQLKSSEPSGVVSDEGQEIIQKHIAPLQQTIQSLEDRLALKDLEANFPMLKDLTAEFDEYRKDYPRHKLENVAKLFLSEKGLLEPKRPGLEKSTGGSRTPPKVGMTLEEFDKLRETNFKAYQELITKGQIPTS